MSLTNKVVQFDADSDLVNEWVHGGPTTSITTDSGPVRSPAKLIADLNASINVDAAGVLAQAVAVAASINVVGEKAVAVAAINTKVAEVEAHKVAGKALIDADVTALDTYRITAQGIIDADVAALDAYRVAGQVLIDADTAALEAHKVSSQSLIDADVSTIEARKTEALFTDIPAAILTMQAYNERGAWATGTAYAIKDVYVDAGIAYVVILAHISTSVAADLAAGKVGIHQGATKEELASPIGASLVGYLPAGTGAVATTVQDKLREQVSVFDSMTAAQIADAKAGVFNAGITPAIQAAIDKVGLVGGTLLFPPATYLVHLDSVNTNASTYYACALKNPYSNVRLVGSGCGSTILKAKDALGVYGVLQMVVTPIVNGTPAISNSSVEHMTIDGNYSGATTGAVPLIYAVGTVNCLFDNLIVKNSAHYGLGMQNGGHIGTTVQNCTFENTFRDGIDVKNNEGSSGSVGKSLKFMNLVFNNCCRGGDASFAFAMLDLMSPGVIVDNIHFHETGAEAGQPITDACLRLKPGIDGDGVGRGIGGQSALISNIYINKQAGSKGIMHGIEVRMPYAKISNVHILGALDGGVRIMQPYCSVSGGTINGAVVGVELRETVGATTSVYPFTGADDCRVTGIDFLNNTTGVSSVQARARIDCNTFTTVTTGVVTSTSGSGNCSIVGNTFISGVTIPISVDTNRNHEIRDNKGAQGIISWSISTAGTLANHSFAVGNQFSFCTGWDGSNYAATYEQFRVGHIANAVNYWKIFGSTAGQPPQLQAQGTDTDIDLRFVPKGAGRMRFGTHTANADAAITGYVEIKDASGVVRKLAVI